MKRIEEDCKCQYWWITERGPFRDVGWLNCAKHSLSFLSIEEEWKNRNYLSTGQLGLIL
jgi:hypothetical protein